MPCKHTLTHIHTRARVCVCVFECVLFFNHFLVSVDCCFLTAFTGRIRKGKMTYIYIYIHYI